MKNFIEYFISDVSFFINYGKMTDPFGDITLKPNFKQIVIFLLTKSGRFSLFLRFTLSIGDIFIGKISLWFLNYIYSCDIDLKLKLGKEIYFPHPFGLVIGGDTIIGSKCVIFNDITFGKKYPGTKDGMPIISDKVMIGVGSRLLGAINIGSRSVIGANSVVLKDIPSNSTFAESKIKQNTYFNRKTRNDK